MLQEFGILPFCDPMSRLKIGSSQRQTRFHKHGFWTSCCVLLVRCLFSLVLQIDLASETSFVHQTIFHKPFYLWPVEENFSFNIPSKSSKFKPTNIFGVQKCTIFWRASLGSLGSRNSDFVKTLLHCNLQTKQNVYPDFKLPLKNLFHEAKAVFRIGDVQYSKESLEE